MIDNDFDKEDILNDFEKGIFKRVKNFSKELKIAQKAAKNYFKKHKNVKCGTDNERSN